MKKVEITPDVLAFLHPEEGPNVGLIDTAKGPVVVDTTMSPPEIRGVLDQAEVDPTEVALVINTHSHSDHTWGNQIFDCSILAHRLCREAMEKKMEDEWSPESIAALIEERGEAAREKWADLRITPPTEVFDSRREVTLGDTLIHVIHVDAHTPDSSVVWLPEERVLFAGDLIFEGRYPFIKDARIVEWAAILKRLPDFRAEAIVPGHGDLCGNEEVITLAEYLETTWELTKDHVEQGDTEDETVADPRYPVYAKVGAERYHEANVRTMYRRIAEN